MAKKYQKAAAARARAYRHKPKPKNPPTEIIMELPTAETYESFRDMAMNSIDLDQEYGSIERKDSETDCQPGTSRDLDELQQNLQQQRKLSGEIAILTKPTP